MDAPPTPNLIDAAVTVLVGVIGWITKRKVTQIDDHLEFVDKRISQLEKETITRDTLNYELDKSITIVHEDIQELKSGHKDILEELRIIARNTK